LHVCMRRGPQEYEVQHAEGHENRIVGIRIIWTTPCKHRMQSNKKHSIVLRNKVFPCMKEQQYRLQFISMYICRKLSIYTFYLQNFYLILQVVMYSQNLDNATFIGTSLKSYILTAVYLLFTGLRFTENKNLCNCTLQTKTAIKA
jgi:hypothetical protein